MTDRFYLVFYRIETGEPELRAAYDTKAEAEADLAYHRSRPAAQSFNAKIEYGSGQDIHEMIP